MKHLQIHSPLNTIRCIDCLAPCLETIFTTNDLLDFPFSKCVISIRTECSKYFSSDFQNS